MAQIRYDNDVSGSEQAVRGSDHRLNTSARTDGRRYYVARDKGKAFSLPYFHDEAAAGENSVIWQNTGSETLVIAQVGLNAEENCKIKMYFATVGTLAGGAVITPTNSNDASPNVAAAVCRQGTSGSGLTGITLGNQIDVARVQAFGHEEFRVDDTIRVGQNNAIVLVYDVGTTGDFDGVIWAFYE